MLTAYHDDMTALRKFISNFWVYMWTVKNSGEADADEIEGVQKRSRGIMVSDQLVLEYHFTSSLYILIPARFR